MYLERVTEGGAASGFENDIHMAAAAAIAAVAATVQGSALRQAGFRAWPATIVDEDDVAIVLSKATDFNESKLAINPKLDLFASQCGNISGNIQQTLCRKDQQMLYLALRHAQNPQGAPDAALCAERDPRDRTTARRYGRRRRLVRNLFQFHADR